ncbi:hypothetical protein T08_15303 [Trichinella sp. T8]|nr:hypothetical protein T08_15303 [Trichinella sp. T8]
MVVIRNDQLNVKLRINGKLSSSFFLSDLSSSALTFTKSTARAETDFCQKVQHVKKFLNFPLYLLKMNKLKERGQL